VVAATGRPQPEQSGWRGDGEQDHHDALYDGVRVAQEEHDACVDEGPHLGPEVTGCSRSRMQPAWVAAALNMGTSGALHHGAAGEIANRWLAEAVAKDLGCPTRSLTTSEAADLWGEVHGTDHGGPAAAAEHPAVEANSTGAQSIPTCSPRSAHPYLRTIAEPVGGRQRKGQPHNIFIELSTYSTNLLTLLVIAAGTDYAIFILGRVCRSQPSSLEILTTERH
jgi:MMPL family